MIWLLMSAASASSKITSSSLHVILKELESRRYTVDVIGSLDEASHDRLQRAISKDRALARQVDRLMPDGELTVLSEDDPEAQIEALVADEQCVLSLQWQARQWSLTAHGCISGPEVVEEVPEVVPEEVPQESTTEPEQSAASYRTVAFSGVLFDLPFGVRYGVGSTGALFWTREMAATGALLGPTAIEMLREADYPALGYENPLFGVDESRLAERVLGGKAEAVECTARLKGTTCTVTVEWQVYDPRSESVIHRSRTVGESRATGDKGALPWFLHSALRDSLDVLLLQEGFRSALLEDPQPEALAAPLDLPACEAAPLALPGDLDAVLSASLLLTQGNSAGSGVLISPEGHALTAAHVVGSASSVSVTLHSGLTLEAQVLRRDAERDVALLKLPGSGHACLTSAGPPDIGEPVWAVGAPGGEELSFSVSQGILSALRQSEDATLLQTDAAINPGNSGGPLVDSGGHLVGVVSWKVAGVAFEGLGFGVSSADAEEALGL